jgi:hypothetical protein
MCSSQIQSVTSAMVSLKRMDDSFPGADLLEQCEKNVEVEVGETVSLKDGAFYWDKQTRRGRTFRLSTDDLEFPSKRLSIIAGRNGKSSLLM